MALVRGIVPDTMGESGRVSRADTPWPPIRHPVESRVEIHSSGFTPEDGGGPRNTIKANPPMMPHWKGEKE